MARELKNRIVSIPLHKAATVLLFLCAVPTFSQAPQPAASTDGPPPATSATITLDRALAVVNRQVILQSDLEDEMQLSVLDPTTNGNANDTKQQALDRLISRTLIQQQIQQENIPAAVPTSAQIAARLKEIRTDLPACVRADCASDAGWTEFLARHELSPERVDKYLRTRLEILSFIELRFRQGIRITPEEVETYYRQTLLPQYPAGQTPPPLQQVSARIEEILLQQRVNALFDTWLSNLRSQGQIQVLDSTLERASADDGASKE
ncbi:SurA N-terminal domain-containing protein [Occallatibacter savannae]|uniref:SurA N-terminal domain-containing protein n=1 Tax=Occallatibacter savannae TaxID=1002691 RepID=UPI000D6892AF|nr:SurA N-terminal domain-containing protein [Occallatibacter savannae]